MKLLNRLKNVRSLITRRQMLETTKMARILAMLGELSAVILVQNLQMGVWKNKDNF